MKKILFVIILLSVFFFQCNYDYNKVVDIPEKMMKTSLLMGLGEYKLASEEQIKNRSFVTSPESEEIMRKNTENMKREIFSNELENIKKLWIFQDSSDSDGNLKLFDLSGIEYCSNVEKLDLIRINPIDISKLLPLIKIKELRIEVCKNINLSFISKMGSIEKLTIVFYDKEKDSSDLYFLADLNNLTELDISISPNLVKDLTPLLEVKEKTKLSKLSLNLNSIDLRPGTPNREVVDKLIEAGVEVFYRDGNIIE